MLCYYSRCQAIDRNLGSIPGEHHSVQQKQYELDSKYQRLYTGNREARFKDCRHNGHSAYTTCEVSCSGRQAFFKAHLLPTPPNNAVPAEQVTAIRSTTRRPLLQAQGAIPPRTDRRRDLRHVQNRPLVLFRGQGWRVLNMCRGFKHSRNSTVINEDLVVALCYSLAFAICRVCFRRARPKITQGPMQQPHPEQNTEESV